MKTTIKKDEKQSENDPNQKFQRIDSFDRRHGNFVIVEIITDLISKKKLLLRSLLELLKLFYFAFLKIILDFKVNPLIDQSP